MSSSLKKQVAFKNRYKEHEKAITKAEQAIEKAALRQELKEEHLNLQMNKLSQQESFRMANAHLVK